MNLESKTCEDSIHLARVLTWNPGCPWATFHMLVTEASGPLYYVIGQKKIPQKAG